MAIWVKQLKSTPQYSIHQSIEGHRKTKVKMTLTKQLKRVKYKAACITWVAN